MRKIAVILLTLCLLICIVPVKADVQEQDFSVTNGCNTLEGQVPFLGTQKILENGKAFILYEANTDTLMYADNADEQLPPASLVKILTALIAVEKGTRQMKVPLRFDPRVELHEKTDIFTFIPDELPEIIVADVSFISLTKVLKYAKMNLARQSTQFLVMLKPQFEARHEQLNKGVVKNEKMRREIIKDFEQWLKNNGFIIINKRDNTLAGKTGNTERFYYLRLSILRENVA